MVAVTKLENLVANLVGQRCACVDNPHGSILSIDFGALGLRADDDPGSAPHGWRHLTILSPWRIESRTEVLCDWNVDGGSSGRIAGLLSTLVGERVVSAATAGPAWDLRIEFSDGSTLIVFSDATEAHLWAGARARLTGIGASTPSPKVSSRRLSTSCRRCTTSIHTAKRSARLLRSLTTGTIRCVGIRRSAT